MPTVDPKWIRNASDVLAVEQGCWFDEDAANDACEFIESCCCLSKSKGAIAGVPMKLIDWQRDFVMRLFGWKNADGLRRFRTAYLEMGKKNGKSALISALAVLLLVYDNEPGPEVYLNACDRFQAEIVFNEAAAMVDANPDLKEMVRVVDTSKRIVCDENKGFIRANSKEVASKDGVNSSATIFDELHRQPDRELWEIFLYAGIARDQPLLISITTAGEDKHGVWWEQRDFSEKVNEGSTPSTTHLGVVYRALPTDDIDDPATWHKANPSLGITITEKDFKEALDKAKTNPSEFSHFKRTRLCIETPGPAQFIVLVDWDASAGPYAVNEIHPLPAESQWIGLDLSSTNDLTAMARIWGDQESGYDLTMRFWLPEDNIGLLEQKHGVPYRQWAEMGLIELTPGSVVDYQYIRREVVQIGSEGETKLILFDRLGATKIALELKDLDGFPVQFVAQTHFGIGAATKELDRLYRSKRLRHCGHPILRWMAPNAVTVRDINDNYILSKKLSNKKIDGLAAIVNALAGAIGQSAVEEGRSVYEPGERGLLVL